MPNGTLFQATGTATQNARLPSCSLVLGTTKLPRAAERRAERLGTVETRMHISFRCALMHVTALLLLKCLRTHCGQHCDHHFPAINARDYRILHIQRKGTTPPASTLACPEADTNFRLALQRSHCFCFTKRPLLLIAFLFNNTPYVLHAQ